MIQVKTKSIKKLTDIQQSLNSVNKECNINISESQFNTFMYSQRYDNTKLYSSCEEFVNVI